MTDDRINIDRFSRWAYTRLADKDARCKISAAQKAQRCNPTYSDADCRECYLKVHMKREGVDE